MNLYFKFIALLIKRLFKTDKLYLTDNCVSYFRVGVFDLDLNFHMNNGKFLSVMDLGRFDLLLKTGYFYKMFGAGYYPVILSESIVFQKSLNYFNKYELHTCLESWDANFFYITQKFYYKGEMVASANVRSCFKKRGRKGIVKPVELFEFVGEEHSEKQLTVLAEKQIAIDEVLFPRKKK